MAHVGDSRAYIFRDGELTRLTQDHSLVEELVRQGKLTEEQAAEHPQRSIITRALGIEGDVEVDTWTYPMRAGDVVLLCCDGLTSMIGEEQILRILGAEQSLDRAADRLIGAANDAGGRDNITVVLFRLEDIGRRPPDGPSRRRRADGGGHGARRRRPRRGCRPRSGDDRVWADRARRRASAGPCSPHRRPSSSASARPRGWPVRRAVRQAQPRGRRPPRFMKPLAALIADRDRACSWSAAAPTWPAASTSSSGPTPPGIVTIFRGFPYNLPLGINMYEQFYVSGVPASAIPADRRARLLNHQLRSQGNAISLVHAAELGQLAR